MVVKKTVLLILMISIIMIAGCISEEKPVVKVTPTETPVPMVEIKNESQPLVKVEIPQVLETEEEWMYRNHGRYLNETWSVSRDNVSGDKDLLLNIEVYAYRFMVRYQESGADSWGTNYWFPHVAPPGWKYLFIFLREEMEGTHQRNDPRIWGFDADNFAVQYKNDFVSRDQNRNPCVPIKELEHVGTSEGETRVSDFGKLRVESMTNPTGKSSAPVSSKVSSSGCGPATSLKNADTIYASVPGPGGIECQDIGFLRMGKSNQWDGYLIYLVPEMAPPEDLKVVGSFGGFGSAWWTLEERPV